MIKKSNRYGADPAGCSIALVEELSLHTGPCSSAARRSRQTKSLNFIGRIPVVPGIFQNGRKYTDKVSADQYSCFKLFRVSKNVGMVY